MEQKETALLRLHQHFPLFKGGFPNRISGYLWLREILCSGACLGLCRMFSNSLVSTRRTPVPSLHLRQSKCAHTLPRAPGLWEVSVTHRKKVKTTPILFGSELPPHQHSPKCYVTGHHCPSPSRVGK